MKKLLTSLAALAALTTAASAADLPRRVAPPVFVPVPVFTWTGFYAGFNAGYGFSVADENGPANGLPAGSTYVVTNDPRVVGDAGRNVGIFAFNNRGDMDGFVGGGQIGYNYQFTPGSGVVIGIEADAQYADLGRRKNQVNCLGLIGGALTQSCANTVLPGVALFNPTGLNGLDFFGTVRGRIGYAFDRVLFYGTAGFAYGSIGGGKAIDTDDFATGYAAGGGIEYALPTDSFLNFFRSSAVTVKFEGLYVNLDQNNRSAYANANGTIISATPLPQFLATPTPIGSIQLNNYNRRDNDFAVVRAGINYKFGSY